MGDKNPVIVEFLVETEKLLDDFMKYMEHMDSRIKKIESQLTHTETWHS